MEGEEDSAAAPAPPGEARDGGDGPSPSVASPFVLPALHSSAGAPEPPSAEPGWDEGAGEMIPMEQVAYQEDPNALKKKKKKKRVGGIMFAEVIVVEQVIQPPSMPPHIPHPTP